VRKVFAATLMLALSASLLLIGGNAAHYYMNNRTAGQIDYHGTEASGVTTASNGNQTNHPFQAASVPPKTDPGHTILIYFPKGNQSKTASTNVTVVPNSFVVSVNQTFSVDVWINNVTDMAGWEINLLWNSSVLKCVRAQVNTPPAWGGVGFDWFKKTASDVTEISVNSVYTAWLWGSGIDNNFSATYGQYHKAENFGPYGSGYDNTFNGSYAIITLTFKALRAGSTSLDFLETADLDSSSAYPNIICNGYYPNIIADGNAKYIAFVDYSGFVEVLDSVFSGAVR
jgi:hypothetical protein